MTKYTTNENYTIWYNEVNMKFYVQKRGCQLSRSGFGIASEAIEWIEGVINAKIKNL